MKTARDPRHLRRKEAFSELFRWNFNKQEELKSELAKKVVKNISLIDVKISKAAQQWPLEKINKVDLAILRLAIFELIIINGPKIPYKVVVDEAVELAKEFGSDSSPGFINGVLGTLITKIENNDNK